MMTRRRMTITIEVDDRPPYGAGDLARDLIEEAASVDGGWWGGHSPGLVGARWVDGPKAGLALDAAEALYRCHADILGGGQSAWNNLTAHERGTLGLAVERAVAAGAIELPGAGWAPAVEHLAEIDRAGDLLMTAWAVIANAYSTPIEAMAEHGSPWATAAIEFREQFHAWLADHPGKAEEPAALAPCGAVSPMGTTCTLEGSAAHDQHEGPLRAVFFVDHGRQVNLVERWS